MVKTNASDRSTSSVIAVGLFLIYLAALIWILLFKLGVRFSYMDDRQVNLVPFSSLLLKDTDITELVLNTIIFVPVGVYTGVIFHRWSFLRKVTISFVISFIVELLQYVFRIGAFDVTDLITNTTGGLIGLLFVYAVKRAFNNHARAHKGITVVAGVGTALMILFLVLLKTGSLGIRYQ